jgi:D-aspartate ligase
MRSAQEAVTRAPGPSARRPSAIVIGLDTSAGLQTSRLLARRGIRVVGIAADARHPATRTNTRSRVLQAETSGDQLMAALQRLRSSEPGAVLIPCTDAAVATLAQEADQLRTFRFVLPRREVVDRLMDKQQFAELLTEHGLPAPRSCSVRSQADAARAASELTFPCVVKPTIKTPGWSAAGAKVRRFASPQAWLAESASLLSLHPDLLVQEWLEGGDETLYSCNCYISPDGIPAVTFVARKLRQWPPSTGTSCLGEAVMDEEIRELALKVLSCVDFCGLGYVEIKRSPADGQDRVIEANVGRPTGRSAIAEAAGVELLYTMYCDTIGDPLPFERLQQDRQMKWIHLRRDLRSSLHYLRHGELTLASWATSLRGPKVFADLDVRDPAPFLGDLGRALKRARPCRRPGSGGHS